MTLKRMTPKTAPVGSRVLCKDRDSDYASTYEARIVEWSPGGRVKLYTAKRAWWNEVPPYLVEALS